jgi:ATP adenylyltransferase
MDNDRLWAPWRLGYVQHGAAAAASLPDDLAWRAGADRDCFLCRAAAVDRGRFRDLGVLERTPLSLVITNRYPYANGHLLVAPLDHRADLADLADDGLLDLQRRIVAWCGRMTRSMQAHGFNVGLNLGAVAGVVNGPSDPPAWMSVAAPVRISVDAPELLVPGADMLTAGPAWLRAIDRRIREAGAQ